MAIKAAFLDRDGVINVDTGYLHRSEDLIYAPQALEGARQLAAQGYKLVIVTNQSGIGRGFYDESAFQMLMQQMGADFARHDAPLLAVYHCPHAPDAECPCRKPAPGMLLQAARDLGIDLTASVMIGDKPGDLEAGRRAGTGRRILIGADGEVTRGADETVVPDLVAAAAWIASGDGTA